MTTMTPLSYQPGQSLSCPTPGAPGCSWTKPPATSRGEVEFEACDGTRCRFSLSLLAQLSSFFRNLLDLPTSCHASDGPPIYTLPSATANGLSYTFDLILAVTEGRSPLPFEIAPFEDVLIIADAYDLPLVSSWMTMQSALLLDKDPFIPYTIASLTGDRKIADMAIKKTVGRDIARMPGWANSLLKRHAPLALIRLYELQSQHAAALEDFGRKMRAQRCRVEVEDFSETCKGGEGCNLYRMAEGDWSAMRSRCAEAVLQSVTRHGMESAPIKDITQAMAWCSRCQGTLEKSFMSAWRETLGDFANSATA